MILLCAITDTPVETNHKASFQTPRQPSTRIGMGRLATGDLPSLIAIYVPTPPSHCQYISVFILVYRMVMQMSRVHIP